MQFISLEFLAFMPAVFVLYWFVFNRTIRLQNAFLLASSYFFYGWWSYKFLLLLIVSTLLDYLYGFGVGNPNKKKARLFLLLSILNNLGILAFFKYYDFFISEVAAGLSLLGLGTNLPLLNIVLPVGISFYTFHGMSYVFDIYRGLRQPVRSF
ncbi:MAG: MBOAT family protein, partial [Bacteroidota bacterium]